MTTSGNFGMTLLGENQATAHVPVNNALTCVDAFLMGAALDRNLKTPPGSPANGDVYLPAYNSYPITAVNQGAKQFTVTGDVTSVIAVNDRIVVAGSTGNDGTYTVTARSYSVPNSTITVSEAIPSATADGNVRHIGGLWNWDSVAGSVPIGKMAYYDGSWKFVGVEEGHRLWLRDEDHMVVYNGSAWQACPGLYYVNPAASSGITNTTSETDFSITKVIKAPALNRAGATFRLGVRGTINLVSTATLTTRIKYGSTTLYTYSAVNYGTTVVNGPWGFDIVLTTTAVGTSGTVRAAGDVCQVSGRAGVATNPNLVTVNTTVDQTLKVSGQWSAASASNSVVIDSFLLEILA